MSGTVKAHGMDGSLVVPDWEPISLEEARASLARFPDCGRPLRIESISPRPFSAACIVLTDIGRVFIKRHSLLVRDRGGLVEEHRFLQHLRAHGAPVPRVFVDGSGQTAVESGDWVYEVHEVPAAVDLYGSALSWTPFLTAEHAHSAGQALGRLHRASEDFKAPRRSARRLVASFTIFAQSDPEPELREYLKARPALAQHSTARECAHEALVLLAPFHSELLPLLPALAPLWTHNDLHASNLLWSDRSADASAVYVIDFGLADRTNAVHDLAHAIERNIVDWLMLSNDPARPEKVPVHFDHLLALLNGYESIRPLSKEEARALAPMVALCHAEFALSEADYFLDVLESEKKARMAYDGWLCGHARWFRSVAGTELLNVLRDWASRRAEMKESR